MVAPKMTQKPDSNESVLSRWSRRKLEKQAATDHDETSTEQQESDSITVSDQEADKEALPIWQQLDVDPETKRAALANLFRQPEFNVVDRMNEYDEDFTSFASLGNIVTHEMKHMLKLAEQKTRPEEELIGKSDLANITDGDIDAEADQTKHVSESQNDNEDNEIA